MKNWFFLFIIFISAVAQVTIADYFKVFGVKPDFILISVVFAVLSLDFKWALAASVFAGILKDVFSVGSFGSNVIVFPLCGFLILRISREIPTDYNIVRVIIVFVCGIFSNIFTRLVILFSGKAIPLGFFLRVTFMESLYTAFTAFVILKIYQNRIK